MQETVLMQSIQSSRITTPIESHPNSTRETGNYTRYIEDKQFPEPTNLDEYYAIKQQPYAFDYFQLEEVANISTYQKYAEFIDEFVREEIKSKSLTNSFDTYKHIVEDILYNLNLHPDTTGNIKIERIYRWIKNILTPQRKIKERKRKLFNG